MKFHRLFEIMVEKPLVKYVVCWQFDPKQFHKRVEIQATLKLILFKTLFLKLVDLKAELFRKKEDFKKQKLQSGSQYVKQTHKEKVCKLCVLLDMAFIHLYLISFRSWFIHN